MSDSVLNPPLLRPVSSLEGRVDNIESLLAELLERTKTKPPAPPVSPQMSDMMGMFSMYQSMQASATETVKQQFELMKGIAASVRQGEIPTDDTPDWVGTLVQNLPTILSMLPKPPEAPPSTPPTPKPAECPQEAPKEIKAGEFPK